MPRRERKWPMTDELRSRVAAYRTAVAIAKEMVGKGIITETDFALAEAEIARNFGLKSFSLFREK